jgi:hypothetical protein
VQNSKTNTRTQARPAAKMSPTLRYKTPDSRLYFTDERQLR